MHLREPHVEAVEAHASGRRVVEPVVGPLQVARHALQLGDQRAVVRGGVLCEGFCGDACRREQEERAGHDAGDDDERDAGGDAGVAGGGEEGVGRGWLLHWCGWGGWV